MDRMHIIAYVTTKVKWLIHNVVYISCDVAGVYYCIDAPYWNAEA